MKVTYGEVNGEGREIFKDPVTDDGMKKSAKGLLRVNRDLENGYHLIDQVSWEEEKGGALEMVFLNGKVHNRTTLTDIRTRLIEEKV